MSTTYCSTCNELGTVCGACGKPRRRAARGFGVSSEHRDHSHARIVRCPNHTPTTYRCDVCGVSSRVALRCLALEVREMRGDGCAACVAALKEAVAVAIDRVLEQRQGSVNHA